MAKEGYVFLEPDGYPLSQFPADWESAIKTAETPSKAGYSLVGSQIQSAKQSGESTETSEDSSLLKLFRRLFCLE